MFNVDNQQTKWYRDKDLDTCTYNKLITQILYLIDCLVKYSFYAPAIRMGDLVSIKIIHMIRLVIGLTLLGFSLTSNLKYC